MRSAWHIEDHGVSLVEMMVVLMIMGIVSAVVISRIARTDEMELAAQANTVRSHIRYAQIMAMKGNNMTWGIKCDGTDYWVFKTASPEIASEPDDTDNMVYLTYRDTEDRDRIKEKKLPRSRPDIGCHIARRELSYGAIIRHSLQRGL